MPAQNGIRILFNNKKSDADQERAIWLIQESVRNICNEHDIFQLELNITHHEPENGQENPPNLPQGY